MEARTGRGAGCVKGQHKIIESKGQIEKLKRELWEWVSKIRTVSDERENKRRQGEDNRQNVRTDVIQTEAIASSKKNEAVEFKWADLLEYEQCDELYEKILEQKEECEEIISAKNHIIREFSEELKEKDEFYNKALHKQENEVTDLISRMRQQYVDLKKEFGNQLEDIEESFLKERDEMIHNNKTEIEELFTKHKEKEDSYSDQRQEMEAKNADEIEQIRADEADMFQEHKIRLEKDLQVIEKCLEDMKAIYQLNLEKLEYNWKVLDEKNKENAEIKKSLGRRITKLKERLSKLNSSYNYLENQARNTNISLTEKYKETTKQYKDLQRKFRHFEKTDNARFNDIWAMNESEVRELANKVLQCDRTIYLQQLGLPWAPPEDATEFKVASESHQQAEETQNEAPSVPMNRIKQVFNLLAEECYFLLEDKVLQQCEGKNEKEQFTIKVDSIRKTLGVDNMSDVELMVNIFYDHANKGEDELYESEGEEDRDRDLLTVEMDEVIDILFEFQHAKEAKKIAGSMKGDSVSMRSAEKSRVTETEKERKDRIRLEEQVHWEKMSKVLPESHSKTWSALEKWFQRYLGLLKERQRMVEETGVLHQQNEELKSLLNQYLQAGVNHELMVPPTQMIKLEEEDEEGEDEEDEEDEV